MTATRHLGGFYRGTNAERIALTPPAAGWIFIETDTLGIFYWDGTYWSLLGYVEGSGGRKYGYYNVLAEYCQGQGILEGLQGYGNLSVTNDANGFWHQWTTGTVADTPAGVIKLRTGGVTRRNKNPTLRFNGFFYPKSAGDSRCYMGYAAFTAGGIPKTDVPLGTGDRGLLFGWRSTDTNFMIFSNDALGGAEFVTDTGIALPGGISGYILELRGNTTNMNWRLYNLVHALQGSGNITTQIPGTASTDTLNLYAVTTNPTGASKALTFMGFDVGVDR